MCHPLCPHELHYQENQNTNALILKQFGSSVFTAAQMLINSSQTSFAEIKYEKVNDKDTKFTGVIVEDYKQTAERLILVVKSQTKTANCPLCGQCSHHLHQNYRF